MCLCSNSDAKRVVQVCPIHDDSGCFVKYYLGQLEDIGNRDAGISRVRLASLGWVPRAWCDPTTTLSVAVNFNTHPRIITEAVPPFRIVHVNRAWEKLCGMSARDTLGNTLSLIQGEATDKKELAKLTSRLTQGQYATSMLLNYKKSGEPFINFLQVSPVLDEQGYVTYFMGQLEDLSVKESLPPAIKTQGDLENLSTGVNAQAFTLPDKSSALAPVAIPSHGCGSTPQRTATPPCSLSGSTTNDSLLSSGAKDAASEVLVGLNNPIKILNATGEFLELFELTHSECVGRSLAILSGPETNSGRIVQMIEAARFGKESEATLVLYSRAGAGSYFNLHAKPFGSPSTPTGCLLSVLSAHAVTVDASMQDDGTVKAVVDATTLRTVYVSRGFVEVYGLPSQMVVGRTLNVIHGPGTDLSRWRSMVLASCQGTRSKDYIVTVTHDCREMLNVAEFRPVINQHGYVSHVLVEILISSPTASGDSSNNSTCKQAMDAPIASSIAHGAPTAHANMGFSNNFQDISAVVKQVQQHHVQQPSPPHPDLRAEPHAQQTHVYYQQARAQHHHPLDACMHAAAMQTPVAAHQVEYQEVAPTQVSTHFPDEIYAQSMEQKMAYTPGVEQFTRQDSFAPSQKSFSSQSNGWYTPNETPGPFTPQSAAESAAESYAPSPLSRSNSRESVVFSVQDFEACSGHGLPSFPAPLSAGGVEGGERMTGEFPRISKGIGNGRQNLDRKAISKVVPRRKPGQGQHEARPVCITLDVLERFSNMSLAKASTVLGISPTAMKKACRRLGVIRWPHGSSSEAAVPAQIDGAYVRRIQRKHAASLRKLQNNHKTKQTASPKAQAAASVGGGKDSGGRAGRACSFPDDEEFVDSLIIDEDKLNDDECEFFTEIDTFPW